MTETNLANGAGQLGKWEKISLMAGILGLVACAFLSFMYPGAFFSTYLISFIFWVSIPIGGMVILMISLLTGGDWGESLRPLLQTSLKTLKIMFLLFLPILFGTKDIFLWAKAGFYDHHPDLAFKSMYLNNTSFWLRGIFYFLCWHILSVLLLVFLRRRALNAPGVAANNPEVKPPSSKDPGRLCGLGLIVYALTASLASVDWIMSLDIHWHSSMFPLIFMVGQVLVSLGLHIVLLRLLISNKVLHESSPRNFHDLGNLLLAFVLVWTYLSLSQFIIIWFGNKPEEVHWYEVRSKGQWIWTSVGLALLQFAMPFIFLLFRKIKRHSQRLAQVSLLLIVMHFIELIWLAVPSLPHRDRHLTWMILLTFLSIGLLWLWSFLRNLKNLTPRTNPL